MEPGQEARMATVHRGWMEGRETPETRLGVASYIWALREVQLRRIAEDAEGT